VLGGLSTACLRHLHKKQWLFWFGIVLRIAS
jgi:hypothetical protein